MENKINIVIHRGTKQIGGCCTEIFTNKSRILIDFGQPLPEENQECMNIDGVTSGKKNCDGIILTHYHMDHIGEINNVLPTIPIYMGAAAKEIVIAYENYINKEITEIVQNINVFNEEETFMLGEFKVTPILSDHSSFQAYMFLIQIYDKTILHTGDFRLHGPQKDRLIDKIKKYKDIDLIITEGTTLTRKNDENDEDWTEYSVKKKLGEYLKRYKYCFLLTSSSNIDRISSFAQEIKRYFIVDDFQKEVLNIAAKYDENCKKYFEKVRTYGVNIQDRFENKGFGMVVRANGRFEKIVKYYIEKYPEDTCLIYSMWSGYKKLDSISKFVKLFKDTFFVHSSGHVVLQDLNSILNVMKPKRILFIHTESKISEINIDLRDRIIKIADGEIISI